MEGDAARGFFDKNTDGGDFVHGFLGGCFTKCSDQRSKNTTFFSLVQRGGETKTWTQKKESQSFSPHVNLEVTPTSVISYWN